MLPCRLMQTQVSTVAAAKRRRPRRDPLTLLREAGSEVYQSRRLIAYLVQADLKKKGSDTVLGNIWWVVDPLLQMLVYVVLVSVIFQKSEPDYPLFIFSAILPWKWFTSSVGDAITSVSGQDKLIKQIKFPKVVLPTASTIAGIAGFAFGLIPLLGLLVLFYRDRLSIIIVLIIPIAVVQLVFTMAFGYLVAATNVFYRDVSNVSRHALRMWFYLSPGLYAASALDSIAKVHPTIMKLMELNPFFTLFESYRVVIYGTDTTGPVMPNWIPLIILLGASLLLLALTTVIFKRAETSFAKVL
jgi:homopolymeric O-antigen transport system permease protein